MKHGDYVSILVTKENHRKLSLLGNKQQTFNDVVSDLIALKLKEKDKPELAIIA